MRRKQREFKKMYNLHFDKIYRYLYWRTGDGALADDLSADVFTRAWQKIDDFDGRHPQAWLFTIAKNLLTDHRRKKSDLQLDEKTAMQIPDSRASAADEIDAQSEQAKLRRALASLPLQVRQVVILRVVENNSAKQTGQLLGLSEANVRVLQHRGLKSLRKWYEANV